MNDDNKQTILVIEDDLSVRKDLTEMLSFEGFQVIGAADGIEGLEKAHKYKPGLILCDIMMPRLDGYGVLQELQKEIYLASIPFIFLTARADREDMRRGMELGADDYLTKPFTVAELLRAVLSRVRKREILQQAIISQYQFDVFLSYSRKDSEIMQRTRSSLLENNLRVWTDENLELGTDDWEHAVVDAMKRANCLAVILSPDAERSKWVGRELAMAETLNLRIFPILARGDERTSIPIRLISHQRVDIRHSYVEGIEKLIVSIRRYLKLDG